MKKIIIRRISLVALFSVIFIFAVACSGSKEESKYHGTWTAFAMEGEGLGVSFDRNNKEGLLLDVLEGNKIELKMGEKTEKGKWKDVENGLEISSGGKTEVATFEDGVLTMDIEGYKAHFHKLDAEETAKEKEIVASTMMKMDIKSLLDTVE